MMNKWINNEVKHLATIEGFATDTDIYFVPSAQRNLFRRWLNQEACEYWTERETLFGSIFNLIERKEMEADFPLVEEMHAE